MAKSRAASRNQLSEIIRTQQEEIVALRGRVEALEAEDIGKLRQRVQELEAWKTQAESRIKQLEEKSAMTQGLLSIIAAAIVALLGEKIVEALQAVPFNELEKQFKEQAGDKLEELEEQFGEGFTKILEAIHRIDTLSLQAWEQQRKVLEKRAHTLPPLKRSMYEALNKFAAPSKVGSQIFNALMSSEEFAQKLTDEDKHKVELLTTVVDTFSNLWPLTVTNSLAPMLKHVGFDEVADAAGEILDQLAVDGSVPRQALRKVHPDLVAMSVIQSTTKPTTVIEYFVDGFNLKQLGYSPDEAASFGHIHSSATQLKRAKRAIDGLEELYNRLKEYPSDISLEHLETFGQALTRATKEKIDEIKEIVEAELTQ